MKRIFLMGYMGAGKTTVGKALAIQMGLSFIDLDFYIEARYHKSVRQLFAERGEDSFRKIENQLLHEVAMFEDVVISTGGGAPCFFDNVSYMNRMGTTVYLKVTPEELAKRLELVRHTRPVLNGYEGEGLKQFVAENLAKREPWYIQATVVFEAEKMLSEKDIKDIAVALKKILS